MMARQGTRSYPVYFALHKYESGSVHNRFHAALVGPVSFRIKWDQQTDRWQIGKDNITHVFFKTIY